MSFVRYKIEFQLGLTSSNAPMVNEPEPEPFISILARRGRFLSGEDRVQVYRFDSRVRFCFGDHP